MIWYFSNVHIIFASRSTSQSKLIFQKYCSFAYFHGKIFLIIVSICNLNIRASFRKISPKISIPSEGHSHNYSQKKTKWTKTICNFCLLDHYVVICNFVDNCTKIGITLMVFKMVYFLVHEILARVCVYKKHSLGQERNNGDKFSWNHDIISIKFHK